MDDMRPFLFFVLLSTAFAAQIRIGKEILDVEIADTQESRAIGLMGRKTLPEGKGMLFVYDKAQRLAFWMKNTWIPLSIGFFDDQKILIKTLDMDPPVGDHLIRYRSTAPARYALEVPQGWFERHKILVGNKFSFLESSDPVE